MEYELEYELREREIFTLNFICVFFTCYSRQGHKKVYDEMQKREKDIVLICAEKVFF